MAGGEFFMARKDGSFPYDATPDVHHFNGVPESCFARVAELTDLSCYSYRQLTADDVIEILRRCY